MHKRHPCTYPNKPVVAIMKSYPRGCGSELVSERVRESGDNVPPPSSLVVSHSLNLHLAYPLVHVCISRRFSVLFAWERHGSIIGLEVFYIWKPRAGWGGRYKCFTGLLLLIVFLLSRVATHTRSLSLSLACWCCTAMMDDDDVFLIF